MGSQAEAALRGLQEDLLLLRTCRCPAGCCCAATGCKCGTAGRAVYLVIILLRPAPPPPIKTAGFPLQRPHPSNALINYSALPLATMALQR